jgi:hypothetical protein
MKVELKKIRVSLTDFIDTDLETWTDTSTKDNDNFPFVITSKYDATNYCWIDDTNIIKCSVHCDISGTAGSGLTDGTQTFEYHHNDVLILSDSGTGGSAKFVIRHKNLLVCNLQYGLTGDTGVGRSKVYYVNLNTMQSKFSVRDYLSSNTYDHPLYLTTTRGLL